MLSIKILGPGCANCKKLDELAHQVVQDLGVEAVFEKVTDHSQIFSYPILSTPGLVINEKVVSSGRIPSKQEISAFVTAALS